MERLVHVCVCVCVYMALQCGTLSVCVCVCAWLYSVLSYLVCCIARKFLGFSQFKGKPKVAVVTVLHKLFGLFSNNMT